MKKQLFIIAGVVAALALLWGAVFAWNNLRGVGPAVKAPPQDITKLVPTTPAAPGQNNTGMPLTLPPGFSISIFAKDLGKPRVLSKDPTGNILVSIPESGKVVALPDRNTDGVADEVVTVAEGLNRPHGLAWYCVSGCKLYIAESDQVAVYDYDQVNLKATNKKKMVDLPNDGRHFTRTILFLPPPNDNKLAIAVGSSCDTCVESDWRRAKILVLNVDTGDLKPLASGLRNSVFMALQPVTGKLWATEMGRDFLGDNLPPDEINIIDDGKNYGWPYCYGKQVHDSKFDPSGSHTAFCATTQASSIDLQAHSAPLGLAFIPQEGWPEEYRNNLLVSFHGSWNRTVPTGYEVVRFKLDAEGKVFGTENFITGWLANGGALGRPVDILPQPGGIVYISDDKAGVIYRVSHQ